MKRQYKMACDAGSRVPRMYQALDEAVEMGMTRDEFKRLLARRPEVYGPFEYLVGCQEFWIRPASGHPVPMQPQGNLGPVMTTIKADQQ